MYLLILNRGGRDRIVQGLLHEDFCIYVVMHQNSLQDQPFLNCTSSVYNICKKSSSGNLPNSVTVAVSKRRSFWSGSDALNLFYFLHPAAPSNSAVPSFLPSSSLTLKYTELFSLLLFSIRFRGDSRVWK